MIRSLVDAESEARDPFFRSRVTYISILVALQHS